MLCIALSICMIFTTGVTTFYAWDDEDLCLGEYNRSEKMYKWTRVKSVADIMEIFGSVEEAKKKDMRLLLIPAISNGSGKAPSFSNYYILDGGEFDKVPLKQNPWIDIKKDVFYSQGGFRTPYLVFDGMKNHNDTLKMFGEAAPTVRIYDADHKTDKKTSNLLVANWRLDTDTAQFVWNESEIGDLDVGNDENYQWELTFPAEHDDSYVTEEMLKDTAYREYAKDMVMVGAHTPKDNKYHMINDDYAMDMFCRDYRLLPLASCTWFFHVSEAFFICYIGVEGEGFNTIEGNATVKNGQTMIMDETSYIRPGATLTINEGGTLFVSGELVNNGTITCKGGTIVVQKGALVHTYTTSNMLDGRIVITDGGELIIREGARMVNFHTKLLDDEHGWCFFIENGSHVLNRGIIAVSGGIRLIGKVDFHNQGKIYLGYTYKNKGTKLQVYSAENTDLTANEFARKATEDFHNLVKEARVSAVSVTEYKERVFRNEGTVFAKAK